MTGNKIFNTGSKMITQINTVRFFKGICSKSLFSLFMMFSLLHSLHANETVANETMANETVVNKMEEQLSSEEVLIEESLRKKAEVPIRRMLDISDKLGL